MGDRTPVKLEYNESVLSVLSFSPETLVNNNMKFFILSLLAACAVASPALSRDDECPTLEEIGKAFEDHFQVEIPEGILDCVHGGEDCPFSSFEAFFEWFEESTGLQVEERWPNILLFS